MMHGQKNIKLCFFFVPEATGHIWINFIWWFCPKSM